MGIFRPLIGRLPKVSTEAEPSDRLLTPANAMTVSRPLLAVIAGRMLIRGDRPVTPVTFAMGISDMEGSIARFLDGKFPEKKIGATKFGAEADKAADTLAVLIIAKAALSAPRVSKPAKLAIAITLGQEGFKASWAIKSSIDYTLKTGNRLDIPTSSEGKEAMAEKLFAIGFACMTNDFDSPRIRHGLEATALSLAITGASRGEKVRREYNQQYEDIIGSLNNINPFEDSLRQVER